MLHYTCCWDVSTIRTEFIRNTLLKDISRLDIGTSTPGPPPWNNHKCAFRDGDTEPVRRRRNLCTHWPQRPNAPTPTGTTPKNVEGTTAQHTHNTTNKTKNKNKKKDHHHHLPVGQESKVYSVKCLAHWAINFGRIFCPLTTTAQRSWSG